MMLNADVRKGGRGWSNADRGERGMKRGHFLRTSFMDDPKVITLESVHLIFLYLMDIIFHGDLTTTSRSGVGSHRLPIPPRFDAYAFAFEFCKLFIS